MPIKLIIAFISSLASFFAMATYTSEYFNLSLSEQMYISKLGELKVGIINDDKRLSNTSPKGDEFYRINVKYIKRIANESNLNVKFVGYETQSEIKDALKEDKINLMIEINDSIIKAKSNISYTTPLMRTSVAYWLMNESRNKFNVAEADLLSLNWTCVRDTIYCSIIEKRGAKKIKRVGFFKEGTNNALNSYSDAFIDSYISLIEYINYSENLNGVIFTPSWGGTVYSQLASKNSKLINVLDSAIRSIEDSNKDFTKNNSYHISDMVNMIYMSENNPNELIKYSFNEDSFPLFYINKDGKISGYIYDILSLIEARTQLRFKYIPMVDNQSLSNMLEQNLIDIVPYRIITASDSEIVELTEPYMDFRYYSVSLSDELDASIGKVGVLLSSGKKKQGIKNFVFGKESIIFSTAKDILKALESGEIKKAYIREDILDVIISSHINDEYKIDRDYYKQLDVAMVVSPRKSLLVDVLNSAFKTFNKNEMIKIKNLYDPFNVVYGLEEKYFYRLTWLFVIILTLSMFSFALFNNRMRIKILIRERSIKYFKYKYGFFETIIQEIPSIVHIKNKNGKVLHSNCSGYNSGTCQGCNLLETKENTLKWTYFTSNVIETSKDKELIRISNCPLNIEIVEYVKKTINFSGTERTLIVMNDITDKTQKETDLRNAKYKAEKAISIRDKFLASMSHELRTPIAGMVGLTEILEEKISGQEEKLMLSNISTSARQLNLLVNDILDFSKLEANQLRLAPFESDLLKETGEIIRAHGTSAVKKELCLDYNFEPTSIHLVSIDALRYSQILNNILSNAVKFTDSGSISVNVRLDDRKISIKVTDTGCGMTPEQLSLVFKPFVQADSSTARKYGGTGLGLSIVLELVELMQGTINIESVEGIGTTVLLTLPHELKTMYHGELNYFNFSFNNVPEDVIKWIKIWCSGNVINEEQKQEISIRLNNGLIKIDRKSTLSKDNLVYLPYIPFYPDVLFDTLLKQVNDESSIIVNTGNKISGKVLVAEDNIINQLVIRKQLEALGLSVHIVDNGKAAYLAIKNHDEAFDLLITDCHMPIMDGFQLSHKLRNELKYLIKIIGCSAEDSQNIRTRAEQAGFDDMLFKPYGIEKLKSVIKANLDDNKYKNIQLSQPYWLDGIALDEVDEYKSIATSCLQDDLQFLNNCRHKGDSPRQVIHKIKGGASSLKINDLAEYAAKLEKIFISQHSIKVEDLIYLEDLIKKHIEQINNYKRY